MFHLPLQDIIVNVLYSQFIWIYQYIVPPLALGNWDLLGSLAYVSCLTGTLSGPSLVITLSKGQEVCDTKKTFPPGACLPPLLTLASKSCYGNPKPSNSLSKYSVPISSICVGLFPGASYAAMCT